MSLKTLSLIIPAYNEERHLSACLDFVAAQTQMPDEVIVVDNNSTDQTAEVASRYPFVTLISESRQGIVFARNAGFNAAKSDIIGRIDADTHLPKNWCAEVRKFYTTEKNQNNALTGGGYFYNVKIPSRGVGGWMLSEIAFRFNRFIMGHYILWGSNMAFTRKQWHKVKNDTCLEVDIHEDLDLAIHLNREGYEVTYMAGLKVGVVMRRVFDDWRHLRATMLLWPRTLKRHGNKKWILGWLGAYFLFIFSPLLILVNLQQKLRSTR